MVILYRENLNDSTQNKHRKSERESQKNFRKIWMMLRKRNIQESKNRNYKRNRNGNTKKNKETTGNIEIKIAENS